MIKLIFLKNHFINILIKCFLILLFIVFASAPYAEEKQDDINFLININPELYKYENLFTSPSYILVALENLELSPLNGGRINIITPQKFRYRVAEISFIEKNNLKYRYKCIIEWNLGVTNVNITLNVIVDFKEVNKGKLTLSINSSLAGLIPKDLLEKINSKIAFLATIEKQSKVVHYLDNLYFKTLNSNNHLTIHELILIDAYNQSTTSNIGVREPGDAEPISDHFLFFITLIIWFFCLPALVIVIRRFINKIQSGSGNYN